MIHILARYRTQEGKSTQVMALLSQMTEASRQEPGNCKYDVYQKSDDPHCILIDEEYLSEEAVAAHRATPHFKDLVELRIIPLLASRTVDKREI